MTLLALQREFLAHIVADDDATLPDGLRYDVYRNNYRAQLLSCLEQSFEKTRKWVGEESFEIAACHYILTSPPADWTLDSYGADFEQVLSNLFAEDPEVAELAWLEWAMQAAFAAPDHSTLPPNWLSSEAAISADWSQIRFALAPGFQSRTVATNVIELWNTIADSGAAPPKLALTEPTQLIVWRKDFSPHFKLIDPLENTALIALNAGQSFGEVCALMTQDANEQAAVATLGNMLAGWIGDGLLSSAIPDRPIHSMSSTMID